MLIIRVDEEVRMILEFRGAPQAAKPVRHLPQGNRPHPLRIIIDPPSANRTRRDFLTTVLFFHLGELF